MSVVQVLAEMGGAATRAVLIAASSRAEVDRALRRGEIVVLARGRYALPEADAAVAAAVRLSGVLSHESAALGWGWPVKFDPGLPHVTVPSGRAVADSERGRVYVHRVDLHPEEIRWPRTSAERTLLDCLRSLPFDAALAVADSALRGGFAPSALSALARDAQAAGSRQARRVAECATADAANPFESVLRAIALDVPGLKVRPQVSIRGREFLGRPDLVDERLQIILEADSFEWHGDRAALRRDANRYNGFVTHGWLVLRFSWEDVMHRPDRVDAALRRAVSVAGS